MLDLAGRGGLLRGWGGGAGRAGQSSKVIKNKSFIFSEDNPCLERVYILDFEKKSLSLILQEVSWTMNGQTPPCQRKEHLCPSQISSTRDPCQLVSNALFPTLKYRDSESAATQQKLLGLQLNCMDLKYSKK